MCQLVVSRLLLLATVRIARVRIIIALAIRVVKDAPGVVGVSTVRILSIGRGERRIEKIRNVRVRRL